MLNSKNQLQPPAFSLQPLQIFLGWDPREQLTYDVADFSIRRRASVPVLIHPLRLDNLSHVMQRPIERRKSPTGQVQLWCPISDAPMATEFAISRFCVPFLQQSGWALFADSDVLCLADIAELFALADDRYAVQVVKHETRISRISTDGESPTKMDGQIQTFYARKNWSSVMLWNCGHPAHARLTHARLNGWPGRDLHAFAWLEYGEIGELPAAWNHLVGQSPEILKSVIGHRSSVIGNSRLQMPDARFQDYPSNPKLLHYTLGGPWFSDWQGGDHDALWLAEREALTRISPMATDSDSVRISVNRCNPCLHACY